MKKGNELGNEKLIKLSYTLYTIFLIIRIIASIQTIRKRTFIGYHNIITPLGFLGLFFHSIVSIGFGNTMIFWVISAVISFLYEEIGVRTGLIYGEYHYTDYFYPKLFHVPVIIPLAWYFMLYPTYVIANVFVERKFFHVKYKSYFQVILISIVNSFLMTCWDLLIEPLQSSTYLSQWEWEKGGEYFGIPIHNFLGWMITVFSIEIVFRSYLKIKKGKEMINENNENSYFVFKMLPLFHYLLIGIGYTSDLYFTDDMKDHKGFSVIGAFGMVFIGFLACIQGLNILNHKEKEK